jgi:hypothetical protein
MPWEIPFVQHEVMAPTRAAQEAKGERPGKNTGWEGQSKSCAPFRSRRAGFDEELESFAADCAGVDRRVERQRHQREEKAIPR